MLLAASHVQAGLCYIPCNSGYYGVGPVCWQRCHDIGYGHMTDSGTYCTARSDGIMTTTAAFACPDQQ